MQSLTRNVISIIEFRSWNQQIFSTFAKKITKEFINIMKTDLCDHYLVSNTPVVYKTVSEQQGAMVSTETTSWIGSRSQVWDIIVGNHLLLKYCLTLNWRSSPEGMKVFLLDRFDFCILYNGILVINPSSVERLCAYNLNLPKCPVKEQTRQKSVCQPGLGFHSNSVECIVSTCSWSRISSWHKKCLQAEK